MPSTVMPGPEDALCLAWLYLAQSFKRKKTDFKLYFIVLQLLISHLGNERHKRF